jgi:hypothetical protein
VYHISADFVKMAEKCPAAEQVFMVRHVPRIIPVLFRQ